jgi:phosphoadenosine phosphosulfate reductase
MQRRGSIGVARAVQVSTKGSAVDTEEWNKQARETRLQHLEAQALETIAKTIDSFERPAFPCALIAGDVVCIHSYPLLCFCLSVCTA